MQEKLPETNKLVRYLIPSSLLYLATPYIIFFAGWLKWYLAMVSMGLVMISLIYCIREIDQGANPKQETPQLSRLKLPHVILLLLICLISLGMSGVGGYGYQNTDWLKHNAILKDLIEQPWPVVYELRGHSLPLVYYVAFYLPAALLGKLGGWSLANQALFAWSFVGLLMAMLWFFALVRGSAYTVFPMFILFSGLDIVGQLTATKAALALRPDLAKFYQEWFHIEWWSFGWQYSSNTTLLFWVPSQAIAGWIISGMLTYTILYSSQKRCALFYLGLASLWSAFVSIGLLPYLLADFLTEKGTLSKRLDQYISLPNICGLTLLAVVGLFYSAKLYDMSPLSAVSVRHGFTLSLIEDAELRIMSLIMIGVFCLLEFGIYSILIQNNYRDWNPKAKGLFITTITCLSLLPFYRYGGMNDLMTRASIPALFVLAVFWGRTLHSSFLAGPKRAVLITLVIIGSATAWVEYHRSATNMYKAGTIVQRQDIREVKTLPQLQIEDIIIQYVGSPQAPFFRFMTNLQQQ